MAATAVRVRSKEPKSSSIRRVAVLGSTGSIGSSTLEVVRHLGKPYRITAMTAGRNWRKLAEQALQTRPKTVVLCDPESEEDFSHLKKMLAASRISVQRGSEAACAVATREDVDIVSASVVGAAGLAPVLAAAKAGKCIALSNKETLVAAGTLVMPLVKKHKATLIPVDSEHSAIFQALRSGEPKEIHRIILTASGGPFRTWPAEKIPTATVQEALNHPNWRMGPKITIDSATLMNKALEIIEAHWLFDLPPERIDVLIHPQSIIHSMIEFVDGSVIAQLGTPDMRTAIQYALTHPRRHKGCSHRLDWAKIREMNFEQPDERFPALQLGYQVIRRGGTSGAVVNAANEVCNTLFREGQIPFGQIVQRTQTVLNKHLQRGFKPDPTLEELLAADKWARQEAAE
ncbi:MAG TPA: 1-deoxy-D-xylulose-5-phosphate reductoisomerase [Phycisphaerae bacterium]|nr:1-deoxy-D-xylulose-5-phosphate reductoisomerase [Phycisphaerae bacterium]